MFAYMSPDTSYLVSINELSAGKNLNVNASNEKFGFQLLIKLPFFPNYSAIILKILQ